MDPKVLLRKGVAEALEFLSESSEGVPRVVFLIFSTGKIVCVGAKKEEDVENLRRMLEEMGLLTRKNI